MTFYIRLLYNIVEGMLHKRNEVISETIWHSRARLSDIDMFMHINNASYFRVAEYARWVWTYESLMGTILNQEGLMPLTTFLSSRFRKPIHLFQKYEIHSKMLEINDKALYIQQKFYIGSNFAASILLKINLVRKSDNVSVNPRETMSKYADEKFLPRAEPGTPEFDALQIIFNLEGYLLGKTSNPSPSSSPTEEVKQDIQKKE
ncbi:MAG: hypothetical protein EZS28_008235 [Streblomastix strix]|uniref:Thioesterase n=1 Tax=Streblomastix strix TaxID=222440 RepID=A0A5J4WQ20_9EUKA|nr:MAG: hypothetical protein EZS28_008235 [Streblomastix strix]